MVQRTISAASERVKLTQPSLRAGRLAATRAAARDERAADIALYHVVDLPRRRPLCATGLLFLPHGIATLPIELAEQAEREPDGADDGDQDQELAEAGHSEHRRI